MDRRSFLASSLVTAAAATVTVGGLAAQTSNNSGSREYYELRRYHLLSGAQQTLATSYFRDALIPALNRLGIGPVGVFSVSIGPQGPSTYVLMPAAKPETLLQAEYRLADDAAYQKAGAAFLNAPQAQPGFVRLESSMLYALEALPKMTPPPTKGQRLFELRTYESTTDQDHRRKVEMVNVGELPIFKKSGFWPIFMGDTLIGGNQPNLTYMIGFPTLADRDAYWATFFGSPEWKALTGNPRYNFEALVANVDNTILAPTAYSQV